MEDLHRFIAVGSRQAAENQDLDDQEFMRGYKDM
jgi:hypothetical protein